MNLSALYVVEYSRGQRCFHVDTLSESLAVNVRAFAEGKPVDYVPLCICLTHDAANEACAHYRALRDARRARRTAAARRTQNARRNCRP